MDLIKTMILTLSALFAALWVGGIIQAKKEEKLEVACKPIGFSISKIQIVATGLIGYTPNWTYSARRVLEGGCVYFFSTFLFADEKGIGSQSTGIRQ